MECRWEASAMREIFAVPSAVVDAHLRMAGAAQLKVLLWWARQGGGAFDPQQCSAAVGVSAVDCLDAMQYWQGVGLVSADGAPVASVTPAPSAPPVSALPAVPVEATGVRRPFAVKPDFGSVMQAQQDDGDFAALLTVAESRLGRCLSHNDMQTLLYLRDTAGMPTAVILMAIEYAVAGDHRNMRYIEKTVLGWCDDDITTVQAAEAHLCAIRRREAAALEVQQLLDLGKLTLAECRMADTWLNEWQIPGEVLLMADEICHKRKGKSDVRYINGILESWRRDGAVTVEAVLALLGKKSAQPNAGASSLQMDEYEEMVARFRPQYVPSSTDGSES